MFGQTLLCLLRILITTIHIHWSFPPPATMTCDPSNQFRCVASGSCIPQAFICDHEDDCGDNSDEEHCGRTCRWLLLTRNSNQHFICIYTPHIDEVFKCGLAPVAESHQCGPGEFTCARGVCIREVWRCDGDNDCRDWSDETNCTGRLTEPLLT